MDCIFCKIANGEIPSEKVYENDKIFAFRDIEPQAPTHILIIPKKHLSSVLECDAETAADLVSAVGVIAKQEGVSESGFRVLTNCGEDGRQSVKHLHLHLLGGRKLSERVD